MVRVSKTQGLLLLALCSIAQFVRADDPAVTTDSLRGRWHVESMQIGDLMLSGTKDKPIALTFQNEKAVQSVGLTISTDKTFSFGSKGFNASSTHTLAFTDGIQSFDYKLADGTFVLMDLTQRAMDGDITRRGICRFNQECLELCIASPNLDRPTDFVTDKTTILYRLKRDTGSE